MCMRRALAAILIVLAHGVPARAAEAPPPQMPPATYKTVAQEVMVPMDDGVKIGTTVTFPSLDGQTPAPGRFPVVLQMTPYGRNGICGCAPGADFAARGMIGAVADVRGTGGSGGSLKDNYFSPREQRDGYNLVEYFGTRPYSTGRVGMTGGSYVGITQYLTAELQPPHLAAITPLVSLSDLYREGYTHDGVPNFFFDSQYLGVQQPASYTGPNMDPALLADTIAAKAGQVPGSATLAFDYLSRPADGPFYRERSPLYRADRIQVPVLIYDGWHDGFIFGAGVMYRELSKRKGVETRLYVDPCTHKGCGPPFDPLTNPDNLENNEAIVFEFLRKYLLGAKVPERPRVRAYVQGADRWLDAPDWPPPTTGLRTFHLTADGLSDSPASTKTSRSYVTKPSDGLSMAFDQYGTVAASPYIPLDQRLEEESGATWRTQPLEQPLTLAGSGALHLVATSTADDTDWIAKLSDVAPDGSETIITAGFLRASYRELDPQRSTPALPWHKDTSPAPIEPGRPYAYDVAIWPTAYELAAGHRLQLRLTSYDFPTHLPGTLVASLDDPASTTFKPLPPATNTIDEGASRLRLNVLGAAPAQQVAGVRNGKPRRCQADRVVIRLPRHTRSFKAYAGKRRVRARRLHRGRIAVRARPGRRIRVVARTRGGRKVIVRRAPRC
jgi:putative CocE/NonD family hydrolase